MDDRTLKKLIERRKRKMRKYVIILVLLVVTFGILNTYLLLGLGLILMILSAASLTQSSTQIVKLRYYRYMTTGYHELVSEENKDRNRYFSEQTIFFIIGFPIFILAIYFLSIGWYGIV